MVEVCRKRGGWYLCTLQVQSFVRSDLIAACMHRIDLTVIHLNIPETVSTFSPCPVEFSERKLNLNGYKELFYEVKQTEPEADFSDQC
jgi:hypothetical protein